MLCTNAELVRRLYVALQTYVLADMFDLMGPGIRIHQDERLPWGGEYRGYGGVRQFLERLVLSVDSRIDIADLVEAGDTVVAIGRLRGQVRATGAAFSIHLVHVWTVQQRRLIGLDAHLDVTALQAALGSAGPQAAGPGTAIDCRSGRTARGITAPRRGHWRVRRAAALARAAS
jgi:uncharacterized protein